MLQKKVGGDRHKRWIFGGLMPIPEQNEKH